MGGAALLEEKQTKENQKMFAFRSELTGLIRKDPTATEAERRRALEAIACVDDGDRSMRFKEVAEMLGLKPATIYRLVKKGELVGVRGTGKRPCGVTKASVNAYIERRKLTGSKK